MSNSSITIGTCGMGTSLAMILSWSINQSIGWAFLHGLLGWFYVVYFYFTYYK